MRNTLIADLCSQKKISLEQGTRQEVGAHYAAGCLQATCKFCQEVFCLPPYFCISPSLSQNLLPYICSHYVTSLLPVLWHYSKIIVLEAHCLWFSACPEIGHICVHHDFIITQMPLLKKKSLQVFGGAKRFQGKVWDSSCVCYMHLCCLALQRGFANKLEGYRIVFQLVLLWYGLLIERPNVVIRVTQLEYWKFLC